LQRAGSLWRILYADLKRVKRKSRLINTIGARAGASTRHAAWHSSCFFRSPRAAFSGPGFPPEELVGDLTLNFSAAY
jgi:hypothetical protein